MTKLEVLKRISDDLEWLYDNAKDKGERDAVDFVEDVVHGWYNAEASKQEEN